VPLKALQGRFDHLETFAELVKLRRQRVGFGALQAAPGGFDKR
jgi:hypothetical protein